LTNPNKTETILARGTELGQVERISSIVTLDDHVNSPELTTPPTVTVGRVSADQNKKWDPPVDLTNSILTEEQKTRVKRMLREECEAFTQSDDDIGCASHLQLGLELMDKKPVQSSYMATPKPLYQEVKDYIANVLHNSGSVNLPYHMQVLLSV
jgi:hypothetical protein